MKCQPEANWRTQGAPGSLAQASEEVAKRVEAYERPPVDNALEDELRNL